MRGSRTASPDNTYGWGLPSGAVPPWRPAVTGVDDGFRVSSPVGSYTPNRWGLYDMHGNVAEWTASRYMPGGPEADKSFLYSFLIIYVLYTILETYIFMKLSYPGIQPQE